MSEDVCSQYGISCGDDAVPLRASLLDIAGLSELFKALSDETRVKILFLVSQRDLCVCDLAFILEMSLPAISHHLRFLKTLRLVRSRKEGKNVFYSLDDGHVVALIDLAKQHYIELK
jgi:ArsR family transcriptional regulator, lead/cadmium/zinc/bismuth-responsive transcriptional repressor